jgi:hypothetical protein
MTDLTDTNFDRPEVFQSPESTPFDKTPKIEEETPKADELIEENKVSSKHGTGFEKSIDGNELVYSGQKEQKLRKSCEKVKECDRSAKKLPSFKDRNDVVNKTILRTIRKFARTKYKADYQRTRYRIEMKILAYFDNWVEDLTTKIQEVFTSSGYYSESEELNFDEIKLILANFVNPRLAKKAVEVSLLSSDQNIQKFLNIFNKWWTNYTHTGFEELLETHHFKAIFRIFLANLNDDNIKGLGPIYSNSATYNKAFWRILERISDD